MNERERERWGHTEELLATIAEMTYELWRLTVRVNSDKNARPPADWRYPRPGVEPDKPRTVSMGDAARMLSRRR